MHSPEMRELAFGYMIVDGNARWLHRPRRKTMLVSKDGLK